MAKPLIAGNWKLNKTGSEALAYLELLTANLDGDPAADVWLFPSYLALPDLCRAAAPWLSVGAQNISEYDAGAYTGEVSARMVAAAGAAGTLIGHSERRHVFGETDAMVWHKVKAAIAAGLAPVVCVGETAAERDDGRAEEVVRRQLRAALNGVVLPVAVPVAVAYEPVWAIGTGRTATPEIAQEMHGILRNELNRVANDAATVPLLYGGSVKPENAAGLLAQPDVDGVLVGGASLDPAAFAAIIAAGNLAAN